MVHENDPAFPHLLFDKMIVSLCDADILAVVVIQNDRIAIDMAVAAHIALEDVWKVTDADQLQSLPCKAIGIVVLAHT